MNKPATLALTLAAALSAAVASALPGTARAGDKIEICHVPPGNPGNAHTISISVRAWPAHAAHGDTMDRCSPPAPPGASSGGGPSGGSSFEIVLCDARTGETGRTIRVSGSGRAMVTDAECQ